MANLLHARSVKPASSVVLYGAGSSGNKFSVGGKTNKNVLGFWVQGNGATGDTRVIYARLYVNGAGGGEAGRFYATATTTSAATGGTLNGIHATAGVDGTGTISGQANAIRATFEATAATRTIGGTCAVLDLDTNIGANNTVSAPHAFLRFANLGSVSFTNLLMIPDVASGGILAAHTTQTMTHSIRIISDDGTKYYLMATTGVTNRTGGA